MVNKALLRDLKKKMEAGAEGASPDAVLKIYEFFKQVAAENDDLKEELADMDIEVSQIITDVDKKYWIKASNGTITYGEGTAANPSFTFSCNMKTGAGMLFGEVDATSAYMAGDITVEGNLQDAMAFQEIIELAMEAFEDLAEDLGDEEEVPPAPKATVKPAPTAAKTTPTKPAPSPTKKEVTVEQKINDAAYYLSQKNPTYDELCWFVAERQLKLAKGGKVPTKDEIKKKAAEVFDQGKSTDELIWLVAKLDITGKL